MLLIWVGIPLAAKRPSLCAITVCLWSLLQVFFIFSFFLLNLIWLWKKAKIVVIVGVMARNMALWAAIEKNKKLRVADTDRTEQNSLLLSFYTKGLFLKWHKPSLWPPATNKGYFLLLSWHLARVSEQSVKKCIH